MKPIQKDFTSPRLETSALQKAMDEAEEKVIVLINLINSIDGLLFLRISEFGQFRL